MAIFRLFRSRLPALLALFLIGACSGGEAAVAPVSSGLHRGINILGADPIWMSPQRARFKARYFETIRQGGFDFVRVNAAALKFVDPQTGIDPRYLRTLDWVVKNAQAAGLSVIIDEHDNNFCGVNAPVCTARLKVFWKQVAERYRGEPRKVLFEILNEPHLQMNDIWNQTVADIIAIIRQSNPTRIIVVGPNHSNNLANLDDLQLPPEDRNILVTFHYYEPHDFTHQGAPWDYTRTLRGVTWGSDADRAAIDRDFDRVAQWAQRNGRPILLGEFGAYDGGGAPVAMRALYTHAVASAAEKRGFAWSYWQFDGDFIAYDVNRNRWVAPIHDALAPAR